MNESIEYITITSIVFTFFRIEFSTMTETVSDKFKDWFSQLWQQFANAGFCTPNFGSVSNLWQHVATVHGPHVRDNGKIWNVCDNDYGDMIMIVMMMVVVVRHK